ncbi:hypothetical protein [Sutcliffiella horikoshii]
MRGDNQYSWWDHFTRRKGNLNRLPELISKLKLNGLDKFITSFTEEQYSKEIRMEYYPEMDIYFANSGQHRTTMAKVVDAPSILAEVYSMKLNTEKHMEFEAKKEIIEKIEKILKELKFHQKNNQIFWNEELIFSCRFTSAFLDQNRLQNTQSLEELLGTLEGFKEEVAKVEQHQNKLLRNPFYRLKVNFQKRIGIYQQVSPYEKKVIGLKKSGWNC